VIGLSPEDFWANRDQGAELKSHFVCGRVRLNFVNAVKTQASSEASAGIYCSTIPSLTPHQTRRQVGKRTAAQTDLADISNSYREILRTLKTAEEERR